MKTILPKELKERLDRGDKIFLVDVREEHERAICHIGGELIPLGQLSERSSEIPCDQEVVVYCRSGGRSGQAIEFLQRLGYSNLTNLTGGVLRWSDDVDATVTKY